MGYFIFNKALSDMGNNVETIKLADGALVQIKGEGDKEIKDFLLEVLAKGGYVREIDPVFLCDDNKRQ